MSDREGHAACVDEWLHRAAPGADSAAVVAFLGRAVLAVWSRASVTLGDVTLTVVLRRVIHSAERRHPVLAPLKLHVDRQALADLDARALPHDVDVAALVAATRFTVTELLDVLGTLTGEVLADALHAEIARLPPSVPPRSPRRLASSPGPDPADGKAKR